MESGDRDGRGKEGGGGISYLIAAESACAC